MIEQTRQAQARTATDRSRTLAAKERDLLGLDAAGVAVDARARAGPRAARLVPGDAGEPAAAERRRDRRVPAAGARGGGEGPRSVAAASPRRSRAADPDRPAGRTLTVTATGYSLHGTTATGVADGLGRRRRRPERDPARHAPDVPGYGDGRGRGHGLGDPGRDDRPLVPDAGAGARLGPADGHDHAALTRLLRRCQAEVALDERNRADRGRAARRSERARAARRRPRPLPDRPAQPARGAGRAGRRRGGRAAQTPCGSCASSPPTSS